MIATLIRTMLLVFEHIWGIGNTWVLCIDGQRWLVHFSKIFKQRNVVSSDLCLLVNAHTFLCFRNLWLCYIKLALCVYSHRTSSWADTWCKLWAVQVVSVLYSECCCNTVTEVADWEWWSSWQWHTHWQCRWHRHDKSIRISRQLSSRHTICHRYRNWYWQPSRHLFVYGNEWHIEARLETDWHWQTSHHLNIVYCNEFVYIMNSTLQLGESRQ